MGVKLSMELVEIFSRKLVRAFLRTSGAIFFSRGLSGSSFGKSELEYLRSLTSSDEFRAPRKALIRPDEPIFANEVSFKPVKKEEMVKEITSIKIVTNGNIFIRKTPPYQELDPRRRRQIRVMALFPS